MIRRPPRSTRTDTLVPYTTLFRSLLIAFAARRALDRGLSLGYLEAQLRLRFGDDQPNAVKTIINTARDPITPEKLRSELDEMAPQLVGRNRQSGGSRRTREDER